MTMYRQWVDFVIHPLDPDRVLTREQRLDVKDAVNTDNGTHLSPEMMDQVHRHGGVITLSRLVGEGDTFEAMEIDDLGNVTVWTKGTVWTVLQSGNIERLLCLRRNPPAVTVSSPRETP